MKGSITLALAACAALLHAGVAAALPSDGSFSLECGQPMFGGGASAHVEGGM